MSSTLIVNPWATRVTPELVAAVERELAAAGPLETVLTARAGHATELAAEASAGERIYVFSGDGGFNEVVNGIEGDVAVGFIPGGRDERALPRARAAAGSGADGADLRHAARPSGRSRSAGSRRRSPARPRSTGAFSSRPGSGWTPTLCARSTNAGAPAVAGPATSPSRGS